MYKGVLAKKLLGLPSNGVASRPGKAVILPKPRLYPTVLVTLARSPTRWVSDSILAAGTARPILKWGRSLDWGMVEGGGG